MSEMERGPKYEYSKEEFLAFLKEYTIWRRNFDDSPKRKQVAELSEEEEDIIYSLYRTKTLEESCEILKPLYQKYRADLKNADMPDLILRSIYFIIMRECVWNIKDNENIHDENGLIRQPVTVGRTGDVFKALGEKSSKIQERLDIRPYWDYVMLSFLPVDFNSLKHRGKVTREVILSILLHYDYPILVDLSGESTIFEDIYYGRNEILNCTDSVVANFYQTLKFKYRDFERYFIKSLSELKGTQKKIEEHYGQMLTDSRKKHEKNESCISTYPDSVDDINLELAFGYLLMKLLKDGNEISDLQETYADKLPDEVAWLKERLNSTVISWEKIEDILAKLGDRLTDNAVLSKDGVDNKDITKSYFTDIDEAIKNELEEMRRDMQDDGEDEETVKDALKKYRANKEKGRLEKGVLFYDYTVQKDMSSIMAFKDFIARDTCYWIFVCDKSDSGWASEIKKYGRLAIEPISDYKTVYWCDNVSSEKVVITNIRVRNLLYDNILRLSSRTVLENLFGITEENCAENFFNIEKLSN